jgi:vesicle-associated membrane protein 7
LVLIISKSGINIVLSIDHQFRTGRLPPSESVMPAIDYAAVIRGHTIIASLGDLAGLSEREVLRLLPSASSRAEQKITFGTLFSFLLTPGLTFVCTSPQSVDKQRPLAFLDALSRRWCAQYFSVSASAADHSLDQIFASNFSELFDEYGRPNKTEELSRELEQTKEILAESVTKALGRGSELESISAKGDTLLGASEEFRNQATNLKWKMRCQYIKSWLWRIIAVIVILWFILSRFCGGWTLTSCL